MEQTFHVFVIPMDGKYDLDNILAVKENENIFLTYEDYREDEYNPFLERRRFCVKVLIPAGMEELSQKYGTLCTEYYVDRVNVNRKMRSLKRKIVRDLLRIKQRTDQIDAILKQYSFNGLTVNLSYGRTN